MGMMNCACNLGHHLHRLDGVQTATLQTRLETLSINQFQDNCRSTEIQINIANGDQSGVIQFCRTTCFLHKIIETLFRCKQFGPQHLKGNLNLETRIPGRVNIGK